MSLFRKLLRVSPYAYLAAIVIVATFLRLYRLDFQSLWYDELHSVVATHPDQSFAALVEYCKTDQPPAFFLLLHGWFKLFAYTEWWGRLLAALIGVAGVVAAFLLGKEMVGTRAGLLAALITATNYFHLYFSQEVRFYGLLFLLSALSYLYFIRCYRRQSWANYALYTLCTTGLLYTHYYGMVVVAAQAITFMWLVAAGIRGWKFFGYGIACGVAILAAFLPWIPTVLKDNAIQAFWIEMPYVYFPLLYYTIYLGHSLYLMALYAIFAVAFSVHVWRRSAKAVGKPEGRIMYMVLGIWLLCSYAIPLGYSWLKVPILHERYTIIALPALFVLFAAGFNLVNHPVARTFLVGFVLAATAFNLVHTTKYYTTPAKNQFREAVQAVMQHNTGGAPVYSDQAWHYSFYFNQFKSPYPVRDAWGVDFATVLSGQSQVWILQGLATNGLYDPQNHYLQQHFDLKQKFAFLGAAAYQYQRKELLVKNQE